jgi:CPA2 family monovalent cation:H+ antiporter-2
MGTVPVPHDVPLILLIGFGLGFGLLFGFITSRLKLSPIVGYLLAGVMVGPHTPGFVADPKLAAQLAEIGVILLMFSVGMHFDISELLRVKGVAIPGAFFQSGTAIALSVLLVPLFGLPTGTALLLGVAVSVASTVVLLRVLIDAGKLHTPEGHTAVGWLIMEDLFTIAALVLLPTIAGAQKGGSDTSLGWAMAKTLGSIAAAFVLILVFGRHVLPRLMVFVARTRSSELFTLAVLVVAMGVAIGSAKLFGVSMALGAFLAGLVVAQSDVGKQAEITLGPFRDVFSVLFFVSVGMLFDPAALREHLWLTLAVLAVVIVGKPLAALLIVLALRKPLRTAVTAAIALGQIGEFSFILGDLARVHGYFEPHHSSILVTVAIVSITLNPLAFPLAQKIEKALGALPGIGPRLAALGKSDSLRELSSAPQDAGSAEAIVVGYGPVGRAVVARLREAGVNTFVIDLNVDTVQQLRREGIPAIFGESQSKEILAAAGIAEARELILAIPEPQQRLDTIRAAQHLNPGIRIMTRTRYATEAPLMEEHGVCAVACDEVEAAARLAGYVMERRA